MTDQRALIPPKTFLGGDNFEVTVYGGRVHLTGYGWRGPEPLTAAEARVAAGALLEAAVEVGAEVAEATVASPTQSKPQHKERFVG